MVLRVQLLYQLRHHDPFLILGRTVEVMTNEFRLCLVSLIFLLCLGYEAARIGSWSGPSIASARGTIEHRLSTEAASAAAAFESATETASASAASDASDASASSASAASAASASAAWQWL